MTISDSALKKIYGTLENLEESCNRSEDCWKGISNLKCSSFQKPYRPYSGEQFNGLMFAGINLNGGNDSLVAIDNLVHEAIDPYLLNGKFKIFNQKGYGGSPFYYYVPLLSFLYHAYSTEGVKFADEDEVTSNQIISGFNYCRLTNLIKCSTNSPEGRSTPSEAMYANCIKKFKKELDVIKPKASVLVVFTYFYYPSLLSDYFDGFSMVSDGERHRIQKNENLFVLELEHPISTAKNRTRRQKFKSYSEAIHELIDLQKKHGDLLNLTDIKL